MIQFALVFCELSTGVRAVLIVGALKPSEVAKKAGVHPGTVSKWLEQYSGDLEISHSQEHVKRDRKEQYPLLNERVMAYIRSTELQFQRTGIGSSWNSVKGTDFVWSESSLSPLRCR